MRYTILQNRLRAALSRLYPGVSFDLAWIKDSDHDWHEGDGLIDRWHVWWNRKGHRCTEPIRPLMPHVGGDASTSVPATSSDAPT